MLFCFIAVAGAVIGTIIREENREREIVWIVISKTRIFFLNSIPIHSPTVIQNFEKTSTQGKTTKFMNTIPVFFLSLSFSIFLILFCFQYIQLIQCVSKIFTPLKSIPIGNISTRMQQIKTSHKQLGILKMFK